MSRAALVGYGQVLFCESPRAGALLLAATAVVSPRAALMSAAACAISTLVARLRRYPVLAWHQGLYGYAAALVGLFGAAVLPAAWATWLLVGAGAALAPATTQAALGRLTPHNLPALALPALALTWTAGALLGLDIDTSAVVSPARAAAAAMLALVGVWLYSRLAAAATALGAIVALALAALPAPDGVLGVVASNTVPTAVALGAVLVPFSAGSLILAGFAAAVAGALSWVAVAPLAAIGVPLLVAPFNAVTLAGLLLLRWRQVRARLPGRPAPLPLVAVSRPEQATRHARDRARLLEWLGATRTVCVLTGAGVSTAAGLPDFRGPFGLGARARRITLQDFVASPAARAEYWQQEEQFFQLVRRTSPAAVHRELATLHRQGRLAAVVTQNVDGLHQLAGVPPAAVIELHGNLRLAACIDCSLAVPRETLSPRIAAGDFALYCTACQGLLKGGSVMFGERVDAGDLDRAFRALLASDLLLVLGTSLLVSPAAEMLRWAREAGLPVAIVNATRTPYDDTAAIAVVGDVGPLLEDALVDAPGAA